MRLEAEILDVKRVDDISELKLTSNLGELYAVSFNKSGDFKVGQKVFIQINSRDIFISKHKIENVSIRNSFKVKIKNIDLGKILSVVTLASDECNEFESIITTCSCKKLDLNVNDIVYSYIKSTSIVVIGND